MNRKSFLRNAAILSLAAGVKGTAAFVKPGQGFNENKPAPDGANAAANKLPAWKGFNLTDFNTPRPALNRKYTSEEQLQWIADWGFNFVRLPIAYPYYLSFNKNRDIRPDEVFEFSNKRLDSIDNLVYLAHKHNLHVSLNMHRAPGYCVNAGFHEPYNLWKDKEAQDAFYFHWSMWAKRYKNVSGAKLSFDLLNEPSMRDDMNDQLSTSGPVPGALYHQVAKAALKVIHEQNSSRIVIADGNSMGNTPIPELADLPLAQSCRGYFPHAISHYKAPWANKEPEKLPVPVYPGKTGQQYFDKAAIEAYYKPWIELMNKGVGIHCGECGAWNKTPHSVVLTWFKDVLDVLAANKIGFSLWEFSGDFGILNSRRTDVAYEEWHGQQLDRQLLSLLQQYK
ncbi:glycoside hydrolase family 5 protein [Filimonas effusa]|uniref:Glycosyl hydrolase family 5 n=1 Tax=Filimonas effusa TaxID=2508721 RepID=A0A4Q1D5H6_9BACT|nr:cellulase family glycosylhydrolase [Filimonas effusa]RXK83226.1 glycosyl hydrolase family 5 [Filimonas effusa]